MKRAFLSIGIAAWFVCFAWCQPSLGQVFRYVDKDGNLHVTDVPMIPGSTPDPQESPKTQKSKPRSVRQQSSTPGSQESPKTQKSKPRSARQQKRTKQPVSTSTAWPVEAGYLVTNFHSVRGHSKIKAVSMDGSSFEVTVAAKDEAIDLALLRIKESDLGEVPPCLPLAHSTVKLGMKVFTMGYPHTSIMGVKPKLTDGIVSGETGYRDDARLCQITVPVQQGNSGSPLLNMEGQVVGIVASKLSAITMLANTGDLPQNVNYAIKVSYLKALMDSASISLKPCQEGFPESESLESLAHRLQQSVLLVVAE